MTVSADLSKYLDKAYESSSLEEILAAPVSALAGVTDDDARRCAGRSGSATWATSGKNKVLRAPRRCSTLTNRRLATTV
jgi:hypothetical protein